MNAKGLYWIAALIAGSSALVAPDWPTFFTAFLIVFGQNLSTRADQMLKRNVISSYERVKELERELEKSKSEAEVMLCDFCTNYTRFHCRSCGSVCCPGCLEMKLCPKCTR